MTSNKQAFDHLADSLAGKDVKFENGSIASYIDQLATAIDNGEVSIGGGDGGSCSPSTPIVFVDFDGSIVAAFDNPPDVLPKNPSHDGLVSQGWNFTAEEIKTTFDLYGVCTVGQMYVTESGMTEIDIDVSIDGHSPYLRFAVDGNAVIDWGDGSEPTTIIGDSLTNVIATKHTFNAGRYTIRINVLSGSISINSVVLGTSTGGQSASYYESNSARHIKSVRIGNNCLIGSAGLCMCHNMRYVTIPSSVTEIGASAFSSCESLLSITVPKGVTSIGDSGFKTCKSLIFAALPTSIESIGMSAFESCGSLVHAPLVPMISSIASSAFKMCTSLHHKLILPSNIESVASYGFNGCGFTEIEIESNSTTISSYAFGSNGYLEKINIPESTEQILSSTFNYCSALEFIEIPSNVTNIKDSAFANCSGLGIMRVLPTVPPTITSSTFTSLPGNCKIYVPAESVDAYKNATNWKTNASKIKAIPA